METKTRVVHLVYYLFIMVMVICWFCGTRVCATELPKHTIIFSESDFQIRLYNESTWMSARVSETSFEQACKTGFHRLYEYIHGANSDSSKIAFTAPVITSVPKSPPGDGYIVRMFVSSLFEGKPPLPNPELELTIEKWKPKCIAAWKFSGYAKDDNISKEIEALVTSLSKHSVKIQDTSSYIIAQYNASFHNTTDRLNEVWIKVSLLGTRC